MKTGRKSGGVAGHTGGGSEASVSKQKKSKSSRKDKGLSASVVSPSAQDKKALGQQTHLPPVEGKRGAPSHWVTRLNPNAPEIPKPISPIIDSIALATAEDMKGIERIQSDYEFTRNLKKGTLDRGWLLSMPSLYELQDSSEVERNFWVAKVDNEPIGYFTVSAPIAMSRALSRHKFFGPVPPDLERAFTRGECLYISQVAVDPSPKFRRQGIMASLLDAVLSSGVYQNYPAVAHIAIDPPNPASEAFFRKQGWQLIGYTSNSPDPKTNTGLDVADPPTSAVMGGLWIKLPAGMHVTSFDGPSRDAVTAHPVGPEDNFNRFIMPRTHPPAWLTSIGDFLEYGSILREGRSNARNARDSLARKPLEPGQVLYARETGFSG